MRAVAGTIATLPAGVLVWGNQVGGIAEGNARLARELLGARADQQHVRAGQHSPRHHDRILDTLHARDGADVEVLAIHHAAIELDAPIAGQHTTSTCVETGIIFERGDRRLHGVERRATRGQNTPASHGRRAAAFPRCLVAVRRNESRAAMHNDRSSHCSITSSLEWRPSCHHHWSPLVSGVFGL